MPSVEELLNSPDIELFADSGSAVEQGIYCEIDPETREINIPEEYRIFGVVGDKRVERVWFKCPRIVGDNIDLSQLRLYVNYRNALADNTTESLDQYIVEDIEEDGDEIIFSWLLSSKVTKYQGEVNFIVHAVRASGETETNVWNTTLAQGETLEGLPVTTPQLQESESDLIQQLLSMVQNASNTAREEIENAGDQIAQRLAELPVVEDHIIKFTAYSNNTLMTQVANGGVQTYEASDDTEADIVTQTLNQVENAIQGYKDDVTQTKNTVNADILSGVSVEEHVIKTQRGSET